MRASRARLPIANSNRVDGLDSAPADTALVDAAPCCSSPNNSPHSYCSPCRSSPVAGSVPRAQLQSNCSQSGCCIASVANAKQPCSRNSLVREPALLVTKTKEKEWANSVARSYGILVGYSLGCSQYSLSRGSRPKQRYPTSPSASSAGIRRPAEAIPS